MFFVKKSLLNAVGTAVTAMAVGAFLALPAYAHPRNTHKPHPPAKPHASHPSLNPPPAPGKPHKPHAEHPSLNPPPAPGKPHKPHAAHAAHKTVYPGQPGGQP